MVLQREGNQPSSASAHGGRRGTARAADVWWPRFHGVGTHDRWVLGDERMVRVGKEAHEGSLPHSRPMDFTGKPMTGMVYVAAEGFADEADLRDWIQRGLAFTRSLPAK